MACKLRQDTANVISWTNNSAAAATKGALVHVGNGMFGVAVDAIAVSATGSLIIEGYFDGGAAVITSTVTIGAALKNNDATIEIANNLIANVIATAGSTLSMSNLRCMTAVTAATTASKTFSFLLGK